MEIKAEKQHLFSSAVAIVLAAAIILGSVITVAAAVQADSSQEQNSADTAQTSKIEFELPNGDMVVGEHKNLEMNVEVIKAYTVNLNHSGKSQTVMLAKGTVADILAKAGITLSDKQVAVPAADTEVTSDMTVTICDAKQITVTADGKTTECLAPTGNVVESLNSIGYAVADDDILDVSKDSEVMDDMNITIKRVTYGEETSTEKIEYKKVRENSDEVEIGETKIGTEGEDGEKLVTKKCKYIDGKKESEEVIDTKTVKEPVDEVTLIGTKGAASNGGTGTFTDSNGVTVSYSQVLTGSGTAYTAPAGAGTATGAPAHFGGVAVNPNIIPYGSKLYIVSTDGSFVYGYATAIDTGGALMDGSAIVDCFYSTYDECVNFGRRNMNVYVIG